MNKDVYLWKMIIKPDSEEGEDPFEFCKKNDILGCGWRLLDENENRIRPRSALQRIHGNPALEASKMIYNNKTGIKYYDVTPVDKNDILEMLLPEDVEEIISFYLQCEKNYLIYSSTNKVDTEKYEFVAIARDGSHLCYPQVKTGNVSLDFNEYDCLTQNGNKVYLFAVSQNYIRNNNSEIIALTKDEIIDFVYNHKAIMSERIKMWL